ncbi:MAG: stage II sporulation protein M, partial [Acutalibacteraceae bacterium]
AFFKAFGMGCLTAYIFSAYELHGFEYFLLIVFPGKILMLFSVLLITETGIEASKNIKQLSQKGSGDKFNTALFLKKMGFILLIMTLSVLIETICIKLFSPLFEQSI